MHTIIDLFLHLDTALDSAIQILGPWTYGLLFLIVLCETGLVITPFLPGDSLLFAAGTFAARGSLSLWALFILFFVAAIAGDALNYFIGSRIGTRIFRQDAWILKREYLDRTREFYAQYGKKTIVLARFIPIVRTVAPFVAGVGTMPYSEFFLYNVIGALIWVTLFLFGGYFFGTISFVKNNFEISILVIIFVSLLPAITEFIKHHMRKSKQQNVLQK